MSSVVMPATFSTQWETLNLTSQLRETSLPRMTSGRDGLVAVSVSDKILVFVGDWMKHPKSEVLDLRTGTWTDLPPIKSPGRYGQAVIIGDLV
eukprot:CAMPEP_0116832474 /NCGR_PEP_ID=MMETSP0418-20121206/5911_1 /TAXON_ID=1158023 /ORGANISM="Astrosyne radiata, Strain 13vi08-1A" /LENGTH=92 /DNA_ID=CAMNT_0004461837 /DNA_START=316 /DNA_END=594 /DNA_ORIENTATION=+